MYKGDPRFMSTWSGGFSMFVIMFCAVITLVLMLLKRK